MIQKQIVILGGGFGGVRLAKKLSKKANLSITLIDQKPYHCIHGQLYEVATSPSELVNLSELKQSVEIPLTKIFLKTKVKLVTARVDQIDLDKKLVLAGGNSYKFDYVVSALGSQPNFYAIPGASDYANHFASSIDALKIRESIENVIAQSKREPGHGPVQIIIAGGGVAGVEIAAELQGMLDYVAWRDSYDRNDLHTIIIERGKRLLSGFPEQVSLACEDRLRKLGVKIKHNTEIESISKNVVIAQHEQIKFDVLIWAAGVKANTILTTPGLSLTVGDRLEVDCYFRSAQNSSLFVLGDQCAWQDLKTKECLPGTASQAIYQADYVANAIIRLTSNQIPEKFSPKTFPYLIPLGGKWAIFAFGSFLIRGYIAYFIRQLVWFRYYVSILGWKKALHWILRTEELYSRND